MWNKNILHILFNQSGGSPIPPSGSAHDSGYIFRIIRLQTPETQGRHYTERNSLPFACHQLFKSMLNIYITFYLTKFFAAHQ